MAKDYTQIWSTIGLNLKAHDGLLEVLGESYKKMYLSQKNRPKGMDYFDFVISEIHGLRVEEIVESKKTGKKKSWELSVFMFPRNSSLPLMAFVLGFARELMWVPTKLKNMFPGILALS